MNESTSQEPENTSSWQTNLDLPIIGQQVSFFQEFYRLSVVGTGLLLNFVVLLVVVFSKQLRYPRHIFWAAVSLVDCLFLAEVVLELAVVVDHDRLACQFFVLFAGVDYSILLLCLSLAACDRFLAITRYRWYKTRVTLQKVILLLASACGLTFLIFTCPFWAGYKSIYNCTVNMTHVFWMFTWDLLLGIICVILDVTIYVKSRAIILSSLPNQQKPITLRFVKNNSAGHSAVNSGGHSFSPPVAAQFPTIRSFPLRPYVNEDDVNAQEENDDPRLPSSKDQTGTECFAWIPGRPKINRLEVRAALSMSVNVFPFWLCTFPVSCQAIALYWCMRLEADCYTTIYQNSSYLRELFMLHSIYNPLMYMITSCEFRKAFFHISWKLGNEFKITYWLTRN